MLRLVSLTTVPPCFAAARGRVDEALGMLEHAVRFPGRGQRPRIGVRKWCTETNGVSWETLQNVLCRLSTNSWNGPKLM
jgi:hypothetical protein